MNVVVGETFSFTLVCLVPKILNGNFIKIINGSLSYSCAFTSAIHTKFFYFKEGEKNQKGY